MRDSQGVWCVLLNQILYSRRVNLSRTIRQLYGRDSVFFLNIIRHFLFIYGRQDFHFYTYMGEQQICQFIYLICLRKLIIN